MDRRKSTVELKRKLELEARDLSENFCLTMALIHKHEEAAKANMEHLYVLQEKMNITLAKLHELDGPHVE